MPFINDKLKYYEEKREFSEAHTQEEVTGTERIRETRFKFDPDQVMGHLRSRVLGQPAALEAVEHMLKVVRADICEPSRPLYVGIFLGPTGVGKTETVKALAEGIYGDEDSFCRVDMNTLSQEHYAAALTGAPPGYVGSKEGSTILDKEKIEGSFSKPGIVMFDEIEKASPQVIQSLLNVFDNGVMVMAAGQKISFHNAIIIMTGNLGAQELYHFADRRLTTVFKRVSYYIKALVGNGEKTLPLAKSIVNKELEKRFSPEFINRIDDIVIFDWMTHDIITQVIDVLIKQLNQRLRKHNCNLILDESAKMFLANQGFDQHFGARALKRTMRQYIEVPLAEHLLKASPDEKFTSYVANFTDGVEIEKFPQPIEQTNVI
ncbi:MAG: AAA family ATPase [Desulfitobacteriaceae bacterium]